MGGSPVETLLFDTAAWPTSCVDRARVVVAIIESSSPWKTRMCVCESGRYHSLYSYNRAESSKGDMSQESAGAWVCVGGWGMQRE